MMTNELTPNTDHPADILCYALSILNTLQYLSSEVAPNKQVNINANDLSITLYLVINLIDSAKNAINKNP